TLIRTILGLIIPDSGEVRINDVTGTGSLEKERRKIGSLIDSPALLMHMNAIDNLKAMALTIGKFEESELRELLHTVGLNVDDKLKVKNFSLGMKQRLAIAIALIGNPQILILDEPVNGLDPAGIFEMRELLERLNRERNITIIISSHLLSELGKLATCYGVLQNGRLVKELRDSELEGLCRPYIKVVVGDLKAALDVVTQSFMSHEFEIMPHNTLALYDLSKSIVQIAEMFQSSNVPVLNISHCEGDLESMFISLMGGLGHEQQ
ncbi:MAG: ATP-binding cassette domain-containing protein, partial [Clostridia bacterium]|nr:ATP-binding cassette domain-containing protein [Clostridia bacterium]